MGGSLKRMELSFKGSVSLSAEQLILTVGSMLKAHMVTCYQPVTDVWDIICLPTLPQGICLLKIISQVWRKKMRSQPWYGCELYFLEKAQLSQESVPYILFFSTSLQSCKATVSFITVSLPVCRRPLVWLYYYTTFSVLNHVNPLFPWSLILQLVSVCSSFPLPPSSHVHVVSPFLRNKWNSVKWKVGKSLYPLSSISFSQLSHQSPISLLHLSLSTTSFDLLPPPAELPTASSCFLPPSCFLPLCLFLDLSRATAC